MVTHLFDSLDRCNKLCELNTWPNSYRWGHCRWCHQCKACYHSADLSFVWTFLLIGHPVSFITGSFRRYFIGSLTLSLLSHYCMCVQEKRLLRLIIHHTGSGSRLRLILNPEISAQLHSASLFSHQLLWLFQWLSFVEFEILPLTPPPLYLKRNLICNQYRILCIVCNVCTPTLL